MNIMYYSNRSSNGSQETKSFTNIDLDLTNEQVQKNFIFILSLIDKCWQYKSDKVKQIKTFILKELFRYFNFTFHKIIDKEKLLANAKIHSQL